MELSPRKKHILKAIVENYIATYEPVGSKLLSEMSTDRVSPATVRNEMSELEELGFIEKPHTSAGRIPSAQGYRFYVDELMSHYKATAADLAQMQRTIEQKTIELGRTLEVASAIVSEMTNQAAVSLSPQHKKFRVIRIEIIPIDGLRYALVGVTVPADVNNRIIEIGANITPEEVSALCSAANSILQTGGASELGILREAAPARRDLQQLISSVVSFAQALEVEGGGDMSVHGASKLLNNPEYSNAARAREILDLLADKGKMAELARTDIPQTINIKIGPENGEGAASEVSFVFTVCEIGDGTNAVIGVIGPTRMDYGKIASQLSLLKRGFHHDPSPKKLPRKNE